MHEYTLFGFFSDTGLRYVGIRFCESVEAAIQSVADIHRNESIVIVAVIAGHHEDLMQDEYIEDTDALKGLT